MDFWGKKCGEGVSFILSFPRPADVAPGFAQYSLCKVLGHTELLICESMTRFMRL